MKVREALLALATMVVAVGLCEVLLQVVDIPPRRGVNVEGKSVVIPSPEYHHDYRPDQTFVRYPNLPGDYPPVEVTVNEAAIRGPSIPPKEPGEERVLLLGDSFLQADEIPWEETVGRILERELVPDSIRVIQHGISSWSPLLELNWLLKKGLALEPDVVVLFLVANDFYPDYPLSDVGYSRQTEFDETGLPARFDLPSADGAPEREPWKLTTLMENAVEALTRDPVPQLEPVAVEALLRADAGVLDSRMDTLFEGIELAPLLKDMIRLTRPVELWDTETREAVELSGRILDQIRGAVEARGGTLVLSLVPIGWNVSLRENPVGRRDYGLEKVVLPMGGIEAWIRDYAEEQGIPYLDVHARFVELAKSGETGLFLDADGHWSPEGHRVVARMLETFLEELSAEAPHGGSLASADALR